GEGDRLEKCVILAIAGIESRVECGDHRNCGEGAGGAEGPRRGHAVVDEIDGAYDFHVDRGMDRGDLVLVPGRVRFESARVGTEPVASEMLPDEAEGAEGGAVLTPGRIGLVMVEDAGLGI